MTIFLQEAFELHNPIKLGILGFGEAAFVISQSLYEQGLQGILVWKRPPWIENIQSRAKEAGVTLCCNVQEVISERNVIFSLVTPNAANKVAMTAAEGLAGKYYVDLNAASLKLKKQTSEVVRSAGGWFIDGAIMGPLKKQRHQVSIIVSGEKAEELAELLNGLGMHIRAVGSQDCLASTVKMVRSVYTKGLEANVVEFMVAAHRFGGTQLVLESLEEILELGPFLLPFRQMVNELMLEQVEHAARRSEEMEQVVDTLKELGVDPWTAQGSLQRLRWISEEVMLREQIEGNTSVTQEEVLAILDRYNSHTSKAG